MIGPAGSQTGGAANPEEVVVKGVKIINVTGETQDTKVVDAETGTPVLGIKEVRIRIATDNLVRAELDLQAVMVAVNAVPTFMVADPDAGELKAVREIHFADGTKWDAALDVTTLDSTVREYARR